MPEINPKMRAAARVALNAAIDSLLASGMPIGDVETELETALDAAIERGHYGAPLEDEPPQVSDDASIWSKIIGPPVPGATEAGRLENAQLAVGRWVTENGEDLLGLLERDPDDLDSAEGLANPAELAAELRDLLAEWDEAGGAFLAACAAVPPAAAIASPPAPPAVDRPAGIPAPAIGDRYEDHFDRIVDEARKLRPCFNFAERNRGCVWDGSGWVKR